MTVFNPIVDRLLRLNRPERVNWLRDLQSGLEFMPLEARRNPQRTLRRIARHDAVRRGTFVLQCRFPRVTASILRRIPVRGSVHRALRTQADCPIIIGLTHVGPSYVAVARLRSFFIGRQMYVIHLDGPVKHKAQDFMRTLGITPIAADVQSLRKLAKSMTEDRHCVAIIGYDFLGGRGKQSVDFLDLRVTAPRGLPYLAELTEADVYAAWLEVQNFAPRLVLTGPYRSNRDLPATDRQAVLIQSLFRILEEQIRKSPEQWTEWPVFAWDHVRARTSRLQAGAESGGHADPID